MAKYRKISPRLWNDAKVRELSDKGKLVFLFLLTHPAMTPFGAIRANAPGLAFELGWGPRTFTKAMNEIIDAGMAVYDAGATLIWFPNFLKYNRPESPNVIRSWAAAFDDLPECALRDRIYETLQSLSQNLGKAFYEAFREAFEEPLRDGFQEPFAQPSPNQEQEQEQEQEQDLNAEESAEMNPAPQLPPAQGDPDDPVFICLPLVGSRERETAVCESEIAYYQELYPGVDVRQQLRSMLGWLNANPARRKTANGVKRFITGWLAREQNRGAANTARAEPMSFAERDQADWEREFAKAREEDRRKRELGDAI